MPTFVDASTSNYSLSPQERRNRQEILEAMQTVQDAIRLLSDKKTDLLTDLKTRTIVSSSSDCIAKIQSYVEKTFTSNTHIS